jgi:hypothetical protein
MSTPEDEFPRISKSDMVLFRIKDTRKRAESLLKTVVPKIKPLHDAAIEIIEAFYECDPFASSTVTIRPAFRPDAVKVQSYPDVFVGLATRRDLGGSPTLRKPNGEPAEYAYFKLLIQVHEQGIRPVLTVSRSAEAQLLFDLLRQHRDASLAGFEKFELRLWHQDMTKGISHAALIDQTVVPLEEQWWEAEIAGVNHEIPSDDPDDLEHVIAQYGALYAWYQAMVDRFFGKPEQFLDHLRRYDEAIELGEGEAPPIGNVTGASGSDEPAGDTPLPGSAPGGILAQETGVRGEVLFDRWLQQKAPGGYNWLSSSQPTAPYDFEVKAPFWSPGDDSLYVEVKTTATEGIGKAVMSIAEVRWAATHSNYQVARINLHNDQHGKLTFLGGMHEKANAVIDYLEKNPVAGVSVLDFEIDLAELKVLSTHEL